MILRHLGRSPKYHKVFSLITKFLFYFLTKCRIIILNNIFKKKVFSLLCLLIYPGVFSSLIINNLNYLYMQKVKYLRSLLLSSYLIPSTPIYDMVYNIFLILMFSNFVFTLNLLNITSILTFLRSDCPPPK